MSTDRSTASKEAGEENPWPWIAILVVVIGWGAWANRNSWYAKLAPYGLTTEDTRTGYSGGSGTA
ncbi:hypothetical protein PJJ84_30475, partial [Mycobacterium kansasii]